MPDTKIDIAEMHGPYWAKFGAVYHESTEGFMFTVRPPSFAEDVARTFNAWSARTTLLDQSQGGRGTTHAEGCWSWGQKHYGCALTALEQSQREVERLNAPDDLEDRKAELMVPLTDEMARAQADLYLDMKARAESSQARVAELTAEVERLKGRRDLWSEDARAAVGALEVRFDISLVGSGHHEGIYNQLVASEALVARLRGALEGVQKIAAEGAIKPSDVDHLRKTIMAMASTAAVALHVDRQALQEGE